MPPVSFSTRSFWWLTAARGFSTLAAQMLPILVGWSIYHHSKSTLALGMAGLCEFVPAFGLALFAGRAVDQGDALRLFRLSTFAQAFVAGLPLLTWAFAAHTPVMLLGSLFAASVLSGAVRAFLQPCLNSITPRVVPREALPWAAGWSSAIMQTARVLGPGLGGIIYGVYGLAVSLSLSLGLVALALGCLLPVGYLTPRASVPHADADPGVLAGLRFVFSHKVLLPALSLDMICVLFGGVTAVLPVFAEEVLKTGPHALGWLRAAPAAGAVLGSLMLTRLDIRPIAGRALLWSVAGFGLCTLCFALSRNVYLSFALLFVSGLLDSVSVQVRQLIVQLLSPEHMRGQIAAVNSMFLGSSNELGEFESGVTAWWLGLVPSVLCGSFACLCFVAFAAKRAATLRTLDLRFPSDLSGR